MMSTEAFLSTPLISDQDWSSAESATLHIDYEHEVGSGAQGRVVDAVLHVTTNTLDYPCVVKYQEHEAPDPLTPLKFKTHRKLTKMAHPGLLGMIGIYTGRDEEGHIHKHAVLPKLDAILSDCLPIIKNLEKIDLCLFNQVLLDFFHSSLIGLADLASQQTVHEDLKPQNIGLRKNTWWIFDFGLAETYDEFKKSISEARGSPSYMAPEILANDRRFPFAVDVWSFGIILSQMLGKDQLFQEIESNNIPALLYAKYMAYQVARCTT